MTFSCAMLQIIGFCLLCDYDRSRQNMSVNDQDQSELVAELDLDEKNSLGVNYLNPDDGLSASQAIKTPVFYILTAIISTVTIPPTIVITFYKVNF